MQSGISASAELHDAFASFLSNTSIFCLPITITSEELVPLDPINFSGNNESSHSQFFSSLPALSDLLQPKTPIYLLIRRPGTGLVALTYVPSNSPVRSKTLFASTRATVARELGMENFSSSIFATEVEEVVGEEEWRERDMDKSAMTDADEGADDRRSKLMGEQEKELHAVKKGEDAARDAWRRRTDIGIGGSQGPTGADAQGVLFKIGDGVKEALSGLGSEGQEGSVVSFAIDAPTETLNVASTDSNIEPNGLSKLIPDSKPQYTFYRYPKSSALIFIYTCPTGSSIKERMLYASGRAGMVNFATGQGLVISQKIEASSPDEITQSRLDEEINPPQEAPKRAFARPKRPGR